MEFFSFKPRGCDAATGLSVVAGKVNRSDIGLESNMKTKEPRLFPVVAKGDTNNWKRVRHNT